MLLCIYQGIGGKTKNKMARLPEPGAAVVKIELGRPKDSCKTGNPGRFSVLLFRSRQLKTVAV